MVTVFVQAKLPVKAAAGKDGQAGVKKPEDGEFIIERV